MSITLALVDAANNCVKRGAFATITLKSGVQFVGQLKTAYDGGDTLHMAVHDPASYDPGWVTFLVDEVAAVSSHR